MTLKKATNAGLDPEKMGKRAVMSWLGIDPHMDGVTRYVHMRGNGANVAAPRLVFFFRSKVAKWTRNSLSNPEELGHYVEVSFVS